MRLLSVLVVATIAGPGSFSALTGPSFQSVSCTRKLRWCPAPGSPPPLASGRCSELGAAHQLLLRGGRKMETRVSDMTECVSPFSAALRRFKTEETCHMDEDASSGRHVEAVYPRTLGTGENLPDSSKCSEEEEARRLGAQLRSCEASKEDLHSQILALVVEADRDTKREEAARRLCALFPEECGGGGVSPTGSQSGGRSGTVLFSTDEAMVNTSSPLAVSPSAELEQASVKCAQGAQAIIHRICERSQALPGPNTGSRWRCPPRVRLVALTSLLRLCRGLSSLFILTVYQLS
jgi:hypothetical protein